MWRRFFPTWISQERRRDDSLSAAIAPWGGQGNYVEPTLFADARQSMRIAQEEIFGPVLTMMPFADEAEAIAMANDIPYGLTGYVWTGNVGRAHRVAQALDAGMIWVNSENVRHLPTPFGGMKASGIAVMVVITVSTSTWRRKTSRSPPMVTQSRRSAAGLEPQAETAAGDRIADMDAALPPLAADAVDAGTGSGAATVSAPIARQGFERAAMARDACSGRGRLGRYAGTGAALRHLPASLSRMIPAMERAGLVQRRPDSKDQRRNRVALATKGRALFSTMALDSERIYEEIAAAIGAEKLAALYKSLDYVIDTLGDSGMPAEDETKTPKLAALP